MPGKSGHKKGKRPYQSRKSKAIIRQSDVKSQQAMSVEKTESVSPQVVVQPKVVQSTATAAVPARTIYPYIKSELRHIVILFGMMLVILIVLSIVLK